jgi:hypothetical protein
LPFPERAVAREYYNLEKAPFWNETLMNKHYIKIVKKEIYPAF